MKLTKKEKWVEAGAVVFNLLYTFFYLRGNSLCYAFGVLGPALFVWLCYRKNLLAEVVLQLFYVGLAVYGYFNQSGTWNIIHWSLTKQIPYVIIGIVLVVLLGNILSKKTKAQLPYIDSFTTVFGIIGTWLMVNYVHENWLYFIAINIVSIYMYTRRGMWMGGLMYVLYLLMSIDGYFQLNIFF